MRGERRKVFSERILHSLGWYVEHLRLTIEMHVRERAQFCVADQSGKVRIWDTVNKEHIMKNEFHPIGGTIKDIAWSPDNQRMVVVGEGRERYVLEGFFNRVSVLVMPLFLYVTLDLAMCLWRRRVHR